MDLITPVFSPIIIAYAVFFSLAIAGLLRWRFKSGFGTIFMGTSLFSLLVISTTTYLAYSDFEQFMLYRTAKYEMNNPVIFAGFVKYALIGFVIMLVINAIMAWFFQTRTATKLGN